MKYSCHSSQEDWWQKSNGWVNSSWGGSTIWYSKSKSFTAYNDVYIHKRETMSSILTVGLWHARQCACLYQILIMRLPCMIWSTLDGSTDLQAGRSVVTHSDWQKSLMILSCSVVSIVLSDTCSCKPELSIYHCACTFYMYIIAAVMQSLLTMAAKSFAQAEAAIKSHCWAETMTTSVQERAKAAVKSSGFISISLCLM